MTLMIVKKNSHGLGSDGAARPKMWKSTVAIAIGTPWPAASAHGRAVPTRKSISPPPAVARAREPGQRVPNATERCFQARRKQEARREDRPQQRADRPRDGQRGPRQRDEAQRQHERCNQYERPGEQAQVAAFAREPQHDVQEASRDERDGERTLEHEIERERHLVVVHRDDAGREQGGQRDRARTRSRAASRGRTGERRGSGSWQTARATPAAATRRT